MSLCYGCVERLHVGPGPHRHRPDLGAVGCPALTQILRDHYKPVDLFALVPTLSLAMEPVITQLNRLLDDNVLFQWFKIDLWRRAPHTATRRRPSTPLEVILHMLVVKRLYHWSYEETEPFVADSPVRRQFCRVYMARSQTTPRCCAGPI
jgi:hypothetical protein